MALIGDLIRDAIQRKRDKKSVAKLAEILAPMQQQGFAGQKVSDLAKLLGVAGQAIPIPQHMGGNALPFSQTPMLRQDQMQQMRPPSAVNAQNQQSQQFRQILDALPPEQAQALMSSIVAQRFGPQKPPTITSVANGYVVTFPTGEYKFTRTKSEAEKLVEVWDEDRKRMVKTTEGAVRGRLAAGETVTAEGPKSPDVDEQWVTAGTSPDGKAMEELVYIKRDPLTGDILSKERTGERRWKGAQTETSELTIGTRAALQEEIYKNIASMDRLTEVRDEWNPKWSYAENQFKQFIVGGVKKSEVADWAVRTFVGDKYEAALQDYAAYKTWDRNLQESINKHIRAMTGAVMNQTEIPRYLREMATKTDDAVAYRAKIDATLKSLARATKLYNQMLDEGNVTTERAHELIAEILEEDLRRITGGTESEQPNWVE